MKGIKQQIYLEFESNELAQKLYGFNEEFLHLLEEKCDVKLYAKGNQLSIVGNHHKVGRVRKILLLLWEKLRQGSHVDKQDVDALIRLSTDQENDTPQNRRGTDMLEKMDKMDKKEYTIRTAKMIISPRSERQINYIDMIRKHDLVFAIGPAGTGKSFLAVALAVELLLQNRIDRIILTRPAVEAGERLGFLPGDLKEKVDPYLRPLYDALHDMLPAEQVTRLQQSNVIEVAPLAYMRGRTLENSFIILDEAQNTTKMQMKMFLTRQGLNSVTIVNGDPTQIDLPSGVESGLVHASQILRNVEGIGFIEFTDKDVVRHPLVARIIKAYDSNALSPIK